MKESFDRIDVDADGDGFITKEGMDALRGAGPGGRRGRCEGRGGGHDAGGDEDDR